MILQNLRILTLVLSIVVAVMRPANGYAEGCRVLVVMSYEEDFIWVNKMREGIESVLSGRCQTEYVYMNTRENIGGGEEKAKEAYERYKRFAPHGVIAADDNAQSMFVVPYLKNKVETPVMFCGVDAQPDKYGYPASNVSGILQHIHILETLVFLKQLLPEVEKVGFMMKKGPTATATISHVKREIQESPVKINAYRTPSTLQEALGMVRELRDTSDALYIGAMQRIRDKNGTPLEDSIVLPLLAEKFGKPVFSNTRFRVQYGALCAVVDLPHEQGQTAAEMLVKAMSGVPVSEIPVTKTQFGRRVININTMEKWGIKPSRAILVGAELVE
jgi:ABC-type uncharacterized transport system substrate-binding protein